MRASLLTALASIALTVVLAEVGLRVFFPVAFREPPPRLAGDVWLELLHQRSTLPGLSYELAPDKWKRSHGTVIRTNHHGMREREIPMEKPASVVRVVALGDSYTFGFGVRAHLAYPRRLEDLLNQRSPGRRFQVLNFGVGGYSTQDGWLGEVKVSVPVRYLPQRLDILDPGLTIVENVARAAPAATGNQIRSQLARFLFRGHRADHWAGTLSGGELFRATLASLLLAEPAPQLLMLDEPTNNLDMASVRQLSGALRSYQGALIVASHDVQFLRELGLTRWLRLDGTLTEIDPL